MERSDARKARQQREGHEPHPDPTVARLIESAYRRGYLDADLAKAWNEGWDAAANDAFEIPRRSQFVYHIHLPDSWANPYRKAGQ